ncbi:MAG TPA: AraC family transcriptional regulator [Oceanospirillaceae bacterium]|nr:AraC family transcriptional regulator [Oceanospirillaceae bacterium]
MPETPTYHPVGLLLLPQASLSHYGQIAELLLHANRILERPYYRQQVLSVGGECVLGRAPDYLASAKVETLFLIGDLLAQVAADAMLERWLLQQSKSGVQILAIGTGIIPLANAGLLKGKRACCHWSSIEDLRVTYPDVTWSHHLFEAEQQLLTCAGGASTTDLMLSWLGQQQDLDLAVHLSEWFLVERMRPQDAQQRIPLKARIGTSQPKLIEAVTLMETNIEEPLSPDDLAYHVGLSRRHLERLFKKHLDSVPSRFYLQLRLDKARQMLRDTDRSIVEVGMACGFSSASHFSTTYRTHFNLTPRQERGRATHVESAPSWSHSVAIQRRLD